MCRIRLTRKLAATLNGLDVSDFSVGEVMNVSISDAAMMVAEGWAESLDDRDGQDSPRGRGLRSIARRRATRRK